MDDHSRVVKSIISSLNHNLPGSAAQNRMAPSLRIGFPFRSSPGSSTRQSAVLICIYPENSKPTTILIKRSTYRGAHSGQISFPGGKRDESDTTIIQTALREAQEEVGIDPNQVDVIGQLTPLYIPVSNMQVVPIIGLMNSPPELHLNLQEVEYTIAANLMDFKNPEYTSVKTIRVLGLPISAPYYSVGGENVWGATAMIISEFTDLY
jgi:8-oxo-dGTP pyrophosphatase MutT (NUDIX family)